MTDTASTIDTTKLLKALPKASRGSIPFGDLARKLKLQPFQLAELREKLLALQAEGKTTLTYGQGWAKR